MVKQISKNILGVNKNIFLLGIVSLLTDISSEMIFSVFSIFFTVILGATTALLGLVEGFADFAASSLDYISGYLWQINPSYSFVFAAIVSIAALIFFLSNS